MDGGARWAAVHGIAKSQTRLSDFTFFFRGASGKVLLPGKSYGQRSLEGYSPWCCKESDTTELLYLHLRAKNFLRLNKNINYNSKAVRFDSNIDLFAFLVQSSSW